MEAPPNGRVRISGVYVAYRLSLAYSVRVPALGHGCLGTDASRIDWLV